MLHKLQMCSVTRHQCRCSQIVKSFHRFTQYSDYLSVTKNDLSSLNIRTNYSWQGFNSYSMSSYANEQSTDCILSLNISVDYLSPNVWKVFTNSLNISTFTFCPLQKMTCHHWTIYSWQGLNTLLCPLMLRRNYSCVQSLNISVDVDKWVKSFTNSPSTHTFCLLLNISCLEWTIYSW